MKNIIQKTKHFFVSIPLLFALFVMQVSEELYGEEFFEKKD